MSAAPSGASVQVGQKVCTKCKRSLPTLAFCGNRNSPDGIDWWCRECKNELAAKVNRRRSRQLGESPKKHKYWMAHFGPID